MTPPDSIRQLSSEDQHRWRSYVKGAQHAGQSEEDAMHNATVFILARAEDERKEVTK